LSACVKQQAAGMSWHRGIDRCCWKGLVNVINEHGLNYAGWTFARVNVVRSDPDAVESISLDGYPVGSDPRAIRFNRNVDGSVSGLSRSFCGFCLLFRGKCQIVSVSASGPDLFQSLVGNIGTLLGSFRCKLGSSSGFPHLLQLSVVDDESHNTHSGQQKVRSDLKLFYDSELACKFLGGIASVVGIIIAGIAHCALPWTGWS